MIEALKLFKERSAKKKGKREFELWAQAHSMEFRILELLDIESRHRPFLNNPRRRKLFEDARQERRSLGLRDELVSYTQDLPFRIDEELARNPEFASSPEELSLLRQVNHGSWARVGFFTPGIRRLSPLK